MRHAPMRRHARPIPIRPANRNLLSFRYDSDQAGCTVDLTFPCPPLPEPDDVDLALEHDATNEFNADASTVHETIALRAIRRGVIEDAVHLALRDSDVPVGVGDAMDAVVLLVKVRADALDVFQPRIVGRP